MWNYYWAILSPTVLYWPFGTGCLCYSWEYISLCLARMRVRSHPTRSVSLSCFSSHFPNYTGKEWKKKRYVQTKKGVYNFLMLEVPFCKKVDTCPTGDSFGKSVFDSSIIPWPPTGHGGSNLQSFEMLFEPSGESLRGFFRMVENFLIQGWKIYL